MQENSNKALAVNTLVLYGKLFITAICGLLTARFSLQALGVTDFGLFSVLGGIISFISIVNTIMVATSNRFIAVEIGRGNIQSINKKFNVCLIIHIAIAVFTMLLMIPIGIYYVLNYVNYDGNINNALIVFLLSSIASAFTFLGVPYNGLLMAKERFLLFCAVDAIANIIKVVVSFMLLYAFQQKLLIYASTIALMTAFPFVVYYVYSKYKFKDLTKFQLVREKNEYKEIFSFSGWVAYGAVACVAKAQGAAILINLFFSTAMNTALGLANNVNSCIMLFAQNVEKPIAPQLTKSYAAGNVDRTNQLLILSTKMSYFAMLLISAPFLTDCNWILSLWLGKVPDYVALFTILLIVDNLINAFNSGIANIIFASGKIKGYQIAINTLRLLAVVVAYFVLKSGYPPYSLIFTYIVSSLIVIITSQYILHKTLNYDNSILMKNSYLPSIMVTVGFVPAIYVNIYIHPFFHIIILIIYLLILMYVIGLNKHEKEYIRFVLNKCLSRL